MSKSLNVSPNYATHFRSGIRELIQNWHDQCKVVGGAGGLVVQDLTPPAAAGGSLLLAACAGRRCCGYLALSSTAGSADVCDVCLCNYGSTVSMAAMTLGESSKRDEDSLAGYFGEVRQQHTALSACQGNACACASHGFHILPCKSRWHAPAAGSQGGDQPHHGQRSIRHLPDQQPRVDLPLRAGAGNPGVKGAMV